MERRSLKKSGKIYCDDHSSLSSTNAVYIWTILYVYFTPFHSSWEILTQQIDLASNVWLHSPVGRASLRYCEGHGFESQWSPVFFQASSFQLLDWKIYCNYHSSLSSTTTVHTWITVFHIYLTLFHSSWEIWTQQIDLAPNVWLHSSVGRASHWYSWRSWVWIPLKPWFFQTSSF